MKKIAIILIQLKLILKLINKATQNPLITKPKQLEFLKISKFAILVVWSLEKTINFQTVKNANVKDIKY